MCMGIESNENYGTDFKQVMTHPFFLETNEVFKRNVVVGHMPVTEYCTHIASLIPIYDAKHNIYSMNGGNMVKYGGQLNALIFEDNTVKWIDVIFFKKKKSFMMSNIIHKFPSLLLLIMVIFKFLNNIRYNQKYIVPTTIVHSGLKMNL